MYILVDDTSVAWDTFKDEGDYFISNTETTSLKADRYIKIIKATNEVIFHNADTALEMWKKYSMIKEVPILIDI